MRQSEDIGRLAIAFVEAQAAFGPMRKGGKGEVKGNKNYRYATLQDALDAVVEPLHEKGIGIVQSLSVAREGCVGVTTRLLHITGQWMEDTFEMPVKSSNPHDVGSALTYARRYSLAAMLAIAPEDDDAAAAQRTAVKPPEVVDPLMRDVTAAVMELRTKHGATKEQVRAFLGCAYTDCGPKELDRLKLALANVEHGETPESALRHPDLVELQKQGEEAL